MENKLYLLREIYDSLSYTLREEVLDFFSHDNVFLIGDRRVGKTTIAFIDAILEGILHDNKRIGIYTDRVVTSVHFDLLARFCNELGMDYSKNSYDKMIFLPNGSTIAITNSLPNHRGDNFDYIVADVHLMDTDSYNDILYKCRCRDFKIIVGQQTQFVRDYLEVNPDNSLIIFINSTNIGA